MEIYSCLFCVKGHKEGELHQVSTFDADSNIRTMITELQDTQLLARIDLIAKEMKYHFECLTALRNRYRSHVGKLNQEENISMDEQRMSESRMFVELANNIEKGVDSGNQLFKLSELHSLYVNHFKDLGILKTVNKTRLKDLLLNYFSGAQEQYDGRNTIIIFSQAMRTMLKKAIDKRDFSGDAIVLAKAAAIIRNNVFNHGCFQFTGSFPHHCQENSLPSSLKSLVS